MGARWTDDEALTITGQDGCAMILAMPIVAGFYAITLGLAWLARRIVLRLR